MNRPLSFLHMTTFYPPFSFGGDAMYLYRLCHKLGDAGHSVDVVHCVDSYRVLHPGPPEVAFAEHPRVVRHELRSRVGRLSPLVTQQTGRPFFKLGHIRKVLNSRRYDVIHFHNTSLLGPKALTLQPGDARAVKMYTTHEHWLVCPMHVLWKFNRQPCDKPACLRCTLHGRRPPQLWRYTGLLDRCSGHIDQFVSPSRFTAEMHAQRGFGQPVAHLPYFIDRVDHEWQSPGLRPHDRPYFLVVGRLEIIKGLQTLIPVWERVTCADLLIVGTGSYEPTLRKMAGSNPRIKFLGALTQKELGPFYYHAVACIIPSITYETFGMINIEAFARKTPVIARDLGALPEVIHDSGGGFVYRDNDGLLAAVDRIATSPSLRTELGENGYRAFVDNWSAEAHMKLYFTFLENAAVRKFGNVPWHGRSVPRDSRHEVVLPAAE